MTSGRRLRLGAFVAALALFVAGTGGWAQTGAPRLTGRTLTIATFGGAFLEADQRNFGDPFSQETGAKVTYIATAPATTAQLIQQEQTGNVVWDLIENTDQGAIILRDGGYLEKWPADVYTHMKLTSNPTDFDEYVLGAGASSFVIACNSKLVAKCPATAKEFFDVRGFPGSRAIYGDPSWATVLALEADGVPANKVFPMDLNRAFAKLRQIKPSVKVWPTTSAQAQQLLEDGETAISFLAHGRAYIVKKSNPAIKVSWDGSLYSGGGLMMPKKSPNRDVAIAFVHWYLDHPKNQAGWSQALSYPTPTKQLLKLLPPDVADAMPTAHKSLARDAGWLAANNDTLQKMWQQFITGQ